MTTWVGARRAIRDRLHGLKIPATWDLAYSTEVGGPFEEGETLTFQSGGTATLIDLVDNGTTGTMHVRMALAGAAPVSGNSITGGTSMATAVVSAAPSGTKEETLTAFTYGPGGRQGPAVYPFAWVALSPMTISRYPSSWRETLIAPVLRIALSPAGDTDYESMMRRRDEWCASLTTRWDGFAALGGEADISVQQQFDDLAMYEDVDRYWGFDMPLENIRTSEVVTFSA